MCLCFYQNLFQGRCTMSSTSSKKVHRSRLYLRAHHVFLFPYYNTQVGAVWRRLGIGLDAAAGTTQVCIIATQNF